MTMPTRVRLARTKGFRLQQHAPGAIVVTRPGRWGNPFEVKQALADDPTITETEARRRCANLFDQWLDGDMYVNDPAQVGRRRWILDHLEQLAGHPLACWCPLPESGQPDHCHALVLLRRANPGATS